MTMREQAAEAQREMEAAAREFKEADRQYNAAKMLGLDSALTAGEPACVSPVVLDHTLGIHEERFDQYLAQPPEKLADPPPEVVASPAPPDLGNGATARVACGGLLHWGFSSVLTPKFVEQYKRPQSTDPLASAAAEWRKANNRQTVPSCADSRRSRGAGTPGNSRPATTADTPSAVLDRQRARDRARFARSKVKQGSERFNQARDLAVKDAQANHRHKQNHEKLLKAQAKDLRGQTIPGRSWRTREVWDDEVLRLQQPNKCLVTPPVGTYHPCDKIASNKASPQGCSFGKAKRFDAMRRKLKKDASEPGPADLIIDGPLAFTGPSLCRGGKVSSSFINDETHVGYAEDIANLRNVRPGIGGLLSPSPDQYQDTDFATRNACHTKYQPSKVGQRFPKTQGKSTIEWIQYYAAQIPGPSDYHNNRDLLNGGVERFRGTKHTYKIFSPHHDPMGNTHDYTIKDEINKTRMNPGPGTYSHPGGKFGGPGRQIGDVPDKHINTAERHTFTEFAQSESYAMQLIHPDKAKFGKPPPGEYFRTVPYDQRHELAKAAKALVEKNERNPLLATTKLTANPFC